MIGRRFSALRSDSGLVVAAWLPWVGAIVLAGVVGGTLGLTGVLGHPTTSRLVLSSEATLARPAAAYSCPGGPQIATLQAGDRVVAVARSADSGFLGVRNPLNLGQTVWVHTGIVAIDSGENPIATLPVDSCPTYGILMPPTNQGGQSSTGTKSSGTTTTTDTTPPTLGIPTSNRSSDNSDPVCVNNVSDTSRESAIITVSASDNRGVTGVSISWNGPGSDHGSKSMTRSGSVWKFKYDPISTTHTGQAEFELQARDAAGNKSSMTKIIVEQDGCVG